MRRQHTGTFLTLKHESVGSERDQYLVPSTSDCRAQSFGARKSIGVRNLAICWNIRVSDTTSKEVIMCSVRPASRKAMQDNGQSAGKSYQGEALILTPQRLHAKHLQIADNDIVRPP